MTQIAVSCGLGRRQDKVGKQNGLMAHPDAPNY
jgi:hypothetical protein